MEVKKAGHGRYSFGNRIRHNVGEETIAFNGGMRTIAVFGTVPFDALGQIQNSYTKFRSYFLKLQALREPFFTASRCRKISVCRIEDQDARHTSAG